LLWWNWKLRNESGRTMGTKRPRAPPTQSQLITSVCTISPTAMVAMAK